MKSLPMKPGVGQPLSLTGFEQFYAIYPVAQQSRWLKAPPGNASGISFAAKV